MFIDRLAENGVVKNEMLDKFVESLVWKHPSIADRQQDACCAIN